MMMNCVLFTSIAVALLLAMFCIIGFVKVHSHSIVIVEHVVFYFDQSLMCRGKAWLCLGRESCGV